MTTLHGTHTSGEAFEMREGIQIARSLTFEPWLVRYINWQALGESRFELACDMDVTQQPDGSVRVTLFWNNKGVSDEKP